MKEMTIEQKAKAYDEAKARMSKAYNSNRCTIGFMNEIFPDIEEREDERIRKAIGYAIGQSTHSDGTLINGVYSEEALAWLKKQGEQKTVDEIAKEVCKNKESAVAFFKSAGIINEKGELAEQYRQGEQKPVDKVVPKFKVKYANSEYNVLEVKDISGVTYYGIEDEPNHIDYVLPDNCEIVSEQNSTWSEEDEDYYDAIISKLEVTQDDALLTDNQMKFLKSLKDRYTWKPSNEQMEGIECTIKTLRYQLNAGDNRLDSLYNDLKKLREK